EIVQEQAMETANRTLEKLQEMDEDLAHSLSAEFKSEPKWSSIFKLNINSDNGISINKRGSGVRRLILLNFLGLKQKEKFKLIIKISYMHLKNLKHLYTLIIKLC